MLTIREKILLTAVHIRRMKTKIKIELLAKHPNKSTLAITFLSEILANAVARKDTTFFSSRKYFSTFLKKNCIILKIFPIFVPSKKREMSTLFYITVFAVFYPAFKMPLFGVLKPLCCTFAKNLTLIPTPPRKFV
jgi:hypothetical protein